MIHKKSMFITHVLQVRVRLAILVPHEKNNTSFSHRKRKEACKGVLAVSPGQYCFITHVFRIPFYISEVKNIYMERLCDSIKECAQRNVFGEIRFMCEVGGD
jgi:hypothetical protein